MNTVQLVGKAHIMFTSNKASTNIVPIATLKLGSWNWPGRGQVHMVDGKYVSKDVFEAITQLLNDGEALRL